MDVSRVHARDCCSSSTGAPIDMALVVPSMGIGSFAGRLHTDTGRGQKPGRRERQRAEPAKVEPRISVQQAWEGKICITRIKIML
jgi:hypothetical protein